MVIKENSQKTVPKMLFSWKIGHGIAIFTLLDWVLESIDALVTKDA